MTDFLAIGSPAFRRALVELIPAKKVKEFRNVIDFLDSQARKIFYEKKAALLKGDEAVSAQIGEGKDILSIMRESN